MRKQHLNDAILPILFFFFYNYYSLNTTNGVIVYAISNNFQNDNEVIFLVFKHFRSSCLYTTLLNPYLCANDYVLVDNNLLIIR